MDLFVLDGQLRRQTIVDDYESFIWTERFNAIGDFELHIRSERGTRALFVVGAVIAINESYRAMIVETVENTLNDDGIMMLKVTGRSLEAILLSRTNRSQQLQQGLSPGPATYTYKPADMIRNLFDWICRTNPYVPGDVIPYLQPGSILPTGTIPEPPTVVTVQSETVVLYELIKKIADVYDIGFRLIRNLDTTQLYFDVITGSDRTTLQTANSVVIFSPSLDNLTNTSELTSTVNYYNTAYVFGKNGSRIVYADGFNDTTSGFQRKALYVKADDIDLAAGAALQSALLQRGQEELNKQTVDIAFDGEIPQSGSYVYGRDYNLGDLVELRNTDGGTNNMRVTEQIFACDAEGIRSYPTLETRLLITPGSWLAWDSGQYWDDATGYWLDLP